MHVTRFSRRKNAFRAHIAPYAVGQWKRSGDNFFSIRFFTWFSSMVSDFDRAGATISQLACDRAREEWTVDWYSVEWQRRNIFGMIARPCVSRAKWNVKLMQCTVSAVHIAMHYALWSNRSDRQIGYRDGWLVHVSVSCDSENTIKRRPEDKKQEWEKERRSGK